MKRKLNSDELLISQRNLNRLKEELEYNLYQLEICDMKLDYGLGIEIKKQIRDYKKLKKEFEEEIKMLGDNIKILEGQIRNGVDVKEENKSGKEEEK